jgi:hypothetical protein
MGCIVYFNPRIQGWWGDENQIKSFKPK